MDNNNLKNKLNMKNPCFVKKNNVEGEVLSYLPDVPFWGRLCDYVFIMTLPGQGEKFAPTYCRLQDKSKLPPEEAISQDVTIEEFKAWADFDQVKEFGRVKETKHSAKVGAGEDYIEEILICAPKSKDFVDFSKIVIIANIPDRSKNTTTVYIRKKRYEKNKNELVDVSYENVQVMDAS